MPDKITIEYNSGETLEDHLDELNRLWDYCPSGLIDHHPTDEEVGKIYNYDGYANLSSGKGGK